MGEQRGLRVFLDVTNLEEGPFPVNLLESIRSSRTFLLLLTESVFDRCLGDDEMNDWVHKEVYRTFSKSSNLLNL